MHKKIAKSHVLKTARFELRIPTRADIPEVFSATRYKGFNAGMMWEAPEQVEELLEPWKRSIKSWEAGNGFSFTIVKKGDQQLLGRISIRQTAAEHIWNVGFWTHPAAQNQGLMTEALQAVLSFGFEELLATRIEAAYALWNKASEKVLTRNGMRFVRQVEKGFQKQGKWVAEKLVAIDRADWALRQ